MFNLNSYFADQKNQCGGSIFQYQPIVCRDGLSFSAQANQMTYCSPRNNVGPYTAVEIGFPSEMVDEFMQYAGTPETPTETVYGWVPVEVVEAVVEKHGGII